MPMLTVDEAYEGECTCDEHEHDYHLCPFGQEVEGDYEKECSCCPFCTEQCAQNI